MIDTYVVTFPVRLQFLWAATIALTAISADKLFPSNATAACLNANCSLFNPATVSNVTYSEFTGVGIAESVFDEIRVRFRLAGANFGSPITISNISLTGDLIDTSLSFDDVTLNANGLFTSPFKPLDNPGTAFNYSNSTISYVIPASSIFVDSLTTLEVSLQYRDTIEGDQITSGNNLISTSVPGPLAIGAVVPLLGFSSKLKRRIKDI